MSATHETAVYTFRVEGVMPPPPTALPTRRRGFDEHYEIEGEHPAESLEKLIHEIQWGILDGYEEWTITFIPNDGGGQS